MWGGGAGSTEATGSDWVLGWCPPGGPEESLGLPALPQEKREPCMAKTPCSGGWATWGWSYLLSLTLPHLPSVLTESELLSSAGPEKWGAMGAGWLMTTRGEASRGPVAGETPRSPRSHRP